MKFNFRIYFFLLKWLIKLVAFSMNYNLQTANKTIICCLKVPLRYFGVFSAKYLLEITDTLIFYSAKPTFQNIRKIGILILSMANVIWKFSFNFYR